MTSAVFFSPIDWNNFYCKSLDHSTLFVWKYEKQTLSYVHTKFGGDRNTCFFSYNLFCWSTRFSAPTLKITWAWEVDAPEITWYELGLKSGFVGIWVVDQACSGMLLYLKSYWKLDIGPLWSGSWNVWILHQTGCCVSLFAYPDAVKNWSNLFLMIAGIFLARTGTLHCIFSFCEYHSDMGFFRQSADFRRLRGPTGKHFCRKSTHPWKTKTNGSSGDGWKRK